MNKRAFGTSRRNPDPVVEELAVVLREEKWFEFKPLFLIVLAGLRARRAAGGGEEMLRLRVYQKLQDMVLRGLVEKVEKKYRGVLAALALLKEQFAAEHSRGLVKAVAAVPGGTRAPQAGERPA